MKAKLLNRYIAKTILRAIILVTLILAALQIFMLFVNEIDDLGKENFGIWQACYFILLQLPYQIYSSFPLACLLGSLIGLGALANYHELIVMRAAGMSIWQISRTILQIGVILIVIIMLIGETIVPKLTTLANDQKIQALSGGQALRTSNGFWLRVENDFMMVEKILQNNELKNVTQFHFDDKQNLTFTRKINTLLFVDDAWQALDVDESFITADKISTDHHSKMLWEVNLKPKILKISQGEPDEMTLPELNKYLKIQKKNHLSATNYKLAYWQRLLQPLTILIMMILAIPFIFGPLRSTTMAAKLITGTTMGFCFYMINKIFGPISQVLQFPVEIAAFAPIMIFSCLGFYLMRRVH